MSCLRRRKKKYLYSWILCTHARFIKKNKIKELLWIEDRRTESASEMLIIFTDDLTIVLRLEISSAALRDAFVMLSNVSHWRDIMFSLSISSACDISHRYKLFFSLFLFVYCKFFAFHTLQIVNELSFVCETKNIFSQKNIKNFIHE